MLKIKEARRRVKLQNHSKDHLQTTLSSQNRIFTLVLVTCSLVGILCVLGSIVWKHESYDSAEKLLIFHLGQNVAQNALIVDKIEKLITDFGQQDLLGPDLLRDLGIALLISAFVTFSIERYSSNRLREHIAYDVLSAAYAKVVPDEIYTQVADNVFRSDVIRRNWEAHIGGEFDSKNGKAEITASYSYQVWNLNGHVLSFPVTGSIDLDVPTDKKDIPRFKSFAVSDLNKSPLIDQKDVEALLRGDGKPKGNVFLERDPEEIRFTALVQIPARGHINVSFEVVREIRVPGSYILHAPVPADGIKIIVRGVTGFKLNVRPLHPAGRELDHSGQADTWEFHCGILPWQGFRLMTEVDPA
jgi:hypothetical protein